MNHKALFLVLFACTVISVYSQNLQLDQLSDLSNENFEKGLYKEAYDLSSRYINISEQNGIKENPNYSDALMTKALCIMILDNSVNEFNALSNQSLKFEYEQNKCSDYYQELIENRNEGLLFFLNRNLNDIKKINTCFELIKGEPINLYTDSIGTELLQICTTLSSHKSEIYSLYDKAVSNYSNEKFITCYEIALKLKNLLEDDSLTNNSLYAECYQIIGLSSLLGKEDYEEFSRAMEIAINLEYQLMGLNYYWYLQCYADGLTKHSKNLPFPENLNLLKKAIDIYEVLPENEESGYQHALSDLSVYYRDIDIKQSVRLAEKALSIQKNTEDPDSIISYSNLCDYYTEIGQFDKAFEYGNIVLSHRKRTADYAGLRIIYKRLAKVLAHKKDFKAAITFAEKSLELSDNLSPVLYSEILNNLGTYYIATDDYSKGKEYLIRSFLYDKSKNNSYNLAGLYSKLNNQDSCKYYTHQTRNIIIEEILHTYRNLDEKDRFNYIHAQDTYHLLYMPIETCINWDYKGLANLSYDCLVQNNILLNSTFDIEDIFDRLHSTNFEAIKSQLSENEIAIEFWSNRDPEVGNFEYIYAFALKRNWNDVKVIKLLKDDIYRTLRNEIPTREDYLPLYESIWKPILSEIDISDGDTLYLSLDDILSQIPIENICGYDWIYMGDKYNIRRVSDTGKISTLKESHPLISAYLYGGAVNSFVSNDSFHEKSILASINRKYLPEIKKSFEYLPWSEVEVDSASAVLCTVLPSKNVYTMKDSLCTKRSIQQLSGTSPSILHFATHGFNISAENYDNISFGYDGHLFAMDHIGLVFSNVGDANEDYILSASEIAKLDLSTTDIVIMSSCNSGIGKFSAQNIDSELIYAFKRAGVQTLIVTLSRIDDAASSFFMKNFYECIASGMSKYHAFKTAQNTLRESEEFSKFPYWAYFVMID